MRKVVRILIWVFLPIFIILFGASFFLEHPYLRIAEFIVDAILVVLIGIELFGKKEK